MLSSGDADAQREDAWRSTIREHQQLLGKWCFARKHQQARML